MATYIPLIFPASWILQKKGLRKSILLGSLGTCLGSWIKVLATHPSSFNLLFSGQTIVAISQIFILGIPAQLAATWFPADQVSSACAIGVFGNQLGVALGFVLPASFIRSSVGSNFVTTQNDLFAMFMAVAIITTVLLIIIIFAFSDKPLNPPSPAQKAAVETLAEEDYLSSIKRLITNKNYILLLITYGLNVGVFYAVSTILNSVVVLYYKDAEVDAGRIGLVIVLCGMVGSMVCGIILDKTHAYKATTFAVYILTAMGMTIFTFTVNLGHIEIVYFTAGVLGFFMTGYLPIGFEFAAEITYPESEGTSSGLLNASAQIFGIICTLIAERLLEFTHKAFIPNGVLIIVLILGCILTGIIKPDYRRQKAAKNQLQEETHYAVCRLFKEAKGSQRKKKRRKSSVEDPLNEHHPSLGTPSKESTNSWTNNSFRKKKKELNKIVLSMGTEQQFCLKWNNHRSTILSVFDTLLEEESLVDVTLTAEGQFLRAHKVILSACSPYFRIMFRAANEKHPVIYMQNVDFENLKALVEYMYKGEANVPQHMLPSFIRTAESLQIRGLAEGASHQYDSSDGSLPPPSHASTPQPLKEKKEKKALSPPPTSGILAARLAKMADHPNPLFNFATQRHPSLPHLPPPPLGNLQKKRRNTVDKDLSPIKQNKMNLHAKKRRATQQVFQCSSSSSLSSRDLKIDEDAGDLGKENRASPANNNNLSHSLSKTDPDEDIADLDANGVESEDEEPSMPAPGSTEMAPGGIINPWTGEDMSQRSGSSSDTGLVGWSGLLGGEFSESAHSPFATPLSATPTPPPPSSRTTIGSNPPPNRLKRFTNNDSVLRCAKPRAVLNSVVLLAQGFLISNVPSYDMSGISIKGDLFHILVLNAVKSLKEQTILSSNSNNGSNSPPSIIEPQIDYEEPRDLSSNSRLREENANLVPSTLLLNSQTEAH
ncbi:FLVCR [Lepeophtheirus salmonis]|uniref:FLVCR n=1 Tax=Lepeophtheirus salmonis TaxID=72036 RepID=A0A7R8D2D9_LEPSM|nr:FLVCR [Lepeophtheirus salmonis]CAF3000448.1 FLVCR [Lepeophtheirus salmonis]